MPASSAAPASTTLSLLQVEMLGDTDARCRGGMGQVGERTLASPFTRAGPSPENSFPGPFSSSSRTALSHLPLPLLPTPLASRQMAQARHSQGHADQWPAPRHRPWIRQSLPRCRSLSLPAILHASLLPPQTSNHCHSQSPRIRQPPRERLVPELYILLLASFLVSVFGVVKTSRARAARKALKACC